MTLFAGIKLWWMNRRIDGLISDLCRVRLYLHQVERDIDDAIRERNALADQHGLKPHPNLSDAEWLIQRRRTEEARQALLRGAR